jgi:hypothetical protein
MFRKERCEREFAAELDGIYRCTSKTTFALE